MRPKPEKGDFELIGPFVDRYGEVTGWIGYRTDQEGQMVADYCHIDGSIPAGHESSVDPENTVDYGGFVSDVEDFLREN